MVSNRDTISAYNDFVSTEKCVEVTGLDKYEVAVLVAKRARELASGDPSVVERGNKKHVNVALAELVSGALDIESLNSRFVRGLTVSHSSDSALAKPSDPLEELRQSMLGAEREYQEGIFSEDMLSGDEKQAISYAEEEIEIPRNKDGSADM